MVPAIDLCWSIALVSTKMLPGNTHLNVILSLYTIVAALINSPLLLKLSGRGLLFETRIIVSCQCGKEDQLGLATGISFAETNASDKENPKFVSMKYLLVAQIHI